MKLTYDELEKFAKELLEHLDYCGWGDSWERECSKPLQDEALKIGKKMGWEGYS